MKINLSSRQSFCLAEEFAKEILARVVEMHLWTVDHIFHTPDAPWAVKESRSSFDEVCAAIRSLPAGSWERRDFVMSVKFHFQRLRRERGTCPKWQDNVALCRVANKDRVPTPWVYQPKEEAA